LFPLTSERKKRRRKRHSGCCFVFVARAGCAVVVAVVAGGAGGRVCVVLVRVDSGRQLKGNRSFPASPAPRRPCPLSFLVFSTLQIGRAWRNLDCKGFFPAESAFPDSVFVHGGSCLRDMAGDENNSNAAGGDANAGENALPTIADDLVVTKYKMAAEITNRKCCTTRPIGAP